MSEKNYGIEFLRILSMFMVVILHVLLSDGTIDDINNLSGNRLIIIFIHSLSLVAVNCFALISGYVMCNSNFRLPKICSLWLQTFFYSAGFCLIFAFINKDFDVGSILKCFLPISTKQYWYISSYFGMFFLIPLLNAVIKHLEKKFFEKTLFMSLIVFCIIFVCIPFTYDPFGIHGGYSMLWLMLMYLTGGYIKKYSVAEKIKKSTAIIVYFVMTIITSLSRPIINVLTKKLFGQIVFEDAFVRYDAVFVTLASIGLFIFFVRLSFSDHLKKIIAFFSPAALGVYLIHFHPNVFSGVLKKVPLNLSEKNPFVVPVLVFAFSLAIYIVCSLIEKGRICLFRLLHIDKLFVKFEDFAKRIYERFYNKFTSEKGDSSV